MYPSYDEMDRTTFDLEEALSAAYQLAVAKWGGQVANLVLPTMSADVDLPPDPDQIVSTQSLTLWSMQLAEVVVPSVTLAWSYQYARTLWHLNIPDKPSPLLADASPQDLEFEEWLMQRWEKQSAAAAQKSAVRAQATRGPRGLPYGPNRAPDMVAELVALAWDTNPDQVTLAGQMVWDKVGDRTKLERFLGEYTHEVGRTVPARIRDLLVGSANRASRLAIPVAELRAEMGGWLKGRIATAGQETGRWFVKGEPAIRYSSRATAEKIAAGREVLPEVEPTSTSLPEGWAKYRTAARESGLDTAGILNHAVLSAASVSDTEFDKVWCSHLDKHTRATHFAADGQQVPIDGQFTVGGASLNFPGDPGGPAKEVKHCRCRVGMNSPGAALPKERRLSAAQKSEIISREGQGIVRARNDPNGIGVVPAKTVAASAAPDQQEESMTIDTVTAAAGETFLTFTDQLFAVTGVPTDDHRLLVDGFAAKMETFPMPMLWQEKTDSQHRGAVGIGVIEAMRYENGEFRGDGYVLNNDNAVQALDLIAHGVAKPSLDIYDATVVLCYQDGTEVTEENFDETKPMYEGVTAGTIRAATVVSIPAFGQTTLQLNATREARPTGLEDAMVAAARFQPPVYAPELFAPADPNLGSTHRLKIDPETGHVYGFLARWTDQHRSVGLGNIKPPRSATNYEHFHTSPGVHLTDGRVLPVGRLTVGIGHAPTRGVSAAAAQAHYDNVDSCWALGRVSEHPLGLYFSGVVAPWASDEKVQMGLASPVSGDWRPIGPGRSLELVAVLSVNTPGFLCKVETDDQNNPLAMVASLGASVADATITGWTLDDVKRVMFDVLADHDARKTSMALSARALSASERARAVFGDPEPPEQPEPEPTPNDRIKAGLARLGIR